MADYQVLFKGELVESASAGAVRDKLARELGLDERKAKRLFSGRTVVIRSRLKQAEAQAWQDRFAELGAICRIKNLAPAAQPLGIRDGVEANSNPERTLRDITAAHRECPRCGYMQLDGSHCTRCGVDLDSAARLKRKEDLIIEKKLQALRQEREHRSSDALRSGQEQERNFRRAQVGDISESKSKPKKGMLSWLKRT